MYINNFYIKKLSNIKYPDAVSYGLTKKAITNILKKFKREISVSDIIEILEYKHPGEKKFVIDMIKIVYNDINLKFNQEDLKRISNSFNNMIDFINFINTISNTEIFTGGDLDKSWKWNMKFEDLLNCRSYKIWSIRYE